MWYQMDYVDGNIFMARDSTREVVVVLPAVYAPHDEHHAPHDEWQACSAYDNHPMFAARDIPNPKRPGTEDMLGISAFYDDDSQTTIPCEYGYRNDGIRSYWCEDCQQYLDF